MASKMLFLIRVPYQSILEVSLLRMTNTARVRIHASMLYHRVWRCLGARRADYRLQVRAKKAVLCHDEIAATPMEIPTGLPFCRGLVPFGLCEYHDPGQRLCGVCPFHFVCPVECRLIYSTHCEGGNNIHVRTEIQRMSPLNWNSRTLTDGWQPASSHSFTA